MEFKYNEKLYGETICKNGFQTEYINSELTILVKYLKEVKSFKRKYTEAFLYGFCEKYIEGFNKVKFFKVIDRAIVNGRKRSNKLIVIDKIPIYKEEIEAIDKLKVEHEHKKLLFTFLVSKKLSLTIRKIHDENINEMSAYFEGNKKRYNDIFKLTNIVGKYKIEDMIHTLVSKKIIESVINGGIVLKFLYPMYDIRIDSYEVKNYKTDKIENREKQIIIYNVKDYKLYENISDFDNIGYVFDYYKGENGIKKCECCKKYIKQKSKKPPKYCEECIKEKQKEWEKLSKAKAKKELGKF